MTLIEVLVVVTILAVIAGVAILNWRGGPKPNFVKRSAGVVALDIRRIQNLTLATKQQSGEIPFGYGLIFSVADPANYTIFVDQDNDMIADLTASPSELYETVPLTPGTVLRDLRAGDVTTSSVSQLIVYFCPPDPTTFINPTADATTRPGRCRAPVDSDIGEVVISSDTNPTIRRTVRILKGGLVEVL